MNKPFTLKVQEVEQQIVEIINKAGTEVPAFCIKVILQDVMKQVNDIDNAEINAYEREIEKSLENKEGEVNGISKD